MAFEENSTASDLWINQTVYICCLILEKLFWIEMRQVDFLVFLWGARGCLSDVSRDLQNNLVKIYNVRNHIYGEHFKLKICTCGQSMALGTRTKFQLEILIWNTISAIHNFRENILESSRNLSETTPRVRTWAFQVHTRQQREFSLTNRLCYRGSSEKWLDSPFLWWRSIPPTWRQWRKWFTPGSGDIINCLNLVTLWHRVVMRFMHAHANNEVTL